ncbi:hypothetical protein HED63_15075 [Ochrobactrum cytisi]|nr:hypothetical protein [Brucella cytisi]
MYPLQETCSARTAAIPTATISHGSRRSAHISQVKQLSSFDFLFVFDFHCLAFTLAMAERVNRGGTCQLRVRMPSSRTVAITAFGTIAKATSYVLVEVIQTEFVQALKITVALPHLLARAR